MINRTVIRTRALQVAYSHFKREKTTIDVTLKELENSLRETYDLYLHFLGLIPDLTEFHSDVLRAKQQKHMPTEDEKNPNMKLANNALAKLLRQNTILNDYEAEAMHNWRSDDAMLSRLLTKILQSNIYEAYLADIDSLRADCKFWLDVFKHIIFVDEDLADFLELESLYWDNSLFLIEKFESEELPDIERVEDEVEELKKNPDLYQSVRAETSPVEIVKDFVLKTIKQVKKTTPVEEIVSPMYKDDEDEMFAVNLLSKTIEGSCHYREILDKYLNNWDSERVADIDMILMQMALCEFFEMPDIPVRITINEYIELSKMFSTSKSYSFVNGVLDNVATEFKKNGMILKANK
ncbi:transcription antitermination factor NusB [Falsiporphyromonas endometrii]|uniref:Transcription antitermination factor NusB n=1 Tax=Falsiporphyromonas endometrii TaxID=1387297 RepID=A0ABV9K5E9_9PORP